jgi:flagellar motor protein MotB
LLVGISDRLFFVCTAGPMKINKEEHDPWVSYTDLMSGFLVVFMIVSMMIFNEYWKIRKDNLQNLITEYAEVFVEDDHICHEIDTVRGSIVLTHKGNEGSLFPFASDRMNRHFRNYIKKIGKPLVRKSMNLWDQRNLKDMELRIEGHTDPVWGGKRNDDDGYVQNLILSSARANYVYRFMLDSLGLDEAEKDFVKQNMISIGYSYSRRLSEGTVDDRSLDKESRRIEFRIISK